MSALTKFAGLVAGVSAVAVIGVAVAQSEPPNPLVTNPAIGAGQQSTHLTPMGETGVLAPVGEIRTAATITRQPEVASVAPAPEPAPAPAPVAQAPAPEPAPTVAMGAAPEPQPEAAPEPRRMRRDRG
jgi:pyruvate/2-oxoglutarate dehydrogenase complex dihydrolipoamide acyltransferase (E2) component